MKIVTFSTFIVSVSMILSCGGGASEEVIRNEFQIEVELSNDCRETSECVIVSPGCPLGCSVAVNQEYMHSVESKAEELISTWEAGGKTCDYSCLYPVAECIDSKCEVVVE